ncbi:hypothetical protein RSOLAG1IB_06125 [Rhizoctonia solani AG-1 IB]|uniref:Uncharacterized protein n=2 Tax=Rhizoctonia solani TaxID=456999 RepID=M5BNR4_THACB|nr:unnamed protein product [Rhizoctonia solani]CCO28699.1 hypothetical protein BN14_02697 [Rhizoctonia solani AG-1 IB]CEL53057.1 hypothetical protein RSOLAG1IB_06125 [Rhizoctonia solani AG-1 IB]
MSGPSVVFSAVMWGPYDNSGSLTARRRDSGTVPHTTWTAQPRIASRRSSIDTRGRRRSSCIASASQLGHAVQPDKAAPKSVRFDFDEHKYPAEGPQEDKIRMPVPVPVKSSVSKPASSPPACRPFHILELPAYRREDVRTELNERLLKTLNDVVPLSQNYPIMSPAAAYVQYELYAICCELAEITYSRQTFIADNIPDVLRRIRRLASNIDALSTPPTQGDADRLRSLANDARRIRKTVI